MQKNEIEPQFPEDSDSYDTHQNDSILECQTG
jgi:hypothetical protein